jgi:DNA-binding transcriptional regulator GbsR (MarR family)
MEVKLTQKQKELIERFGVFMERAGSAPVQARIIALLMVSDKTELTFEDIHNTLQVSKSAVSNAINSLMLLKKIEYHTKPGDRKRYFSSRLVQTEDFANKFGEMLEINMILKEILDQRPKQTKDFNARMQKAIDFIEFLKGELPELYKKWAKYQK